MQKLLRPALELLVLVLAAWQVAVVGEAMATRLGANFDLEWMEGATLITGMRAAEGLPFYTAPSADYIPFLYPPLYAWVLGALSHVFPLGYALGRGISIACTAVAAGLLAVAARREGARWPLAIGVAAAFLGCYEEGGTFYDLVRIDALALALTGGALVAGRAESRRGAVLAGLLLAVAFTAKHNMALFGLPLALWRWRTRGHREALVFVAAAALPALVFTVAMQIYTDGLFLTYLLEVPSVHGMVAERALPNLKNGRVEGAQAELFRALPLLVAAGLATAWSWGRTRGGAYWAGVMGTGLVMVSLMRGHQGGYLNVLIPMFWALPMLAVLPLSLAGPTGWRRAVPHAVALLLAAQLQEGRGALTRFLPTEVDATNAAALVEDLRALPGPVLMPHGPWYPVMAGHAPSFALIALWDIDHKGGPLARASRVVDEALADHRWATVITPDDKLGHGLSAHYARGAPLEARPFGTRTGWGVRFRTVWHPKPAEAAPSPAEGDE